MNKLILLFFIIFVSVFGNSTNNTNISPNSNNEWVKFTLNTTNDEIFIIKNLKVDTGHILNNVPISKIENSEFDIKHEVKFGCEGALFSPTGTSGSFDIFHKSNLEVCNIVFDSPWASRNYLNLNNKYSNSRYICISSPWKHSGPLGDILINCYKRYML